jgi:choice-of-anchor A domain-containing protein
MNIVRTIALAVLGISALSTSNAMAQGLGAASNYNVYVLGNAYQQGADAEGGVAVGGNLSVGNYGFTTGWQSGGGKLVVNGDINNQGHSVHRDGVFAGGNLNYAQTVTSVGGVVANGNVSIGGGQPSSVVHGGSYSYTGTESFGVSQGMSSSPIDFASTNAYLKEQSAYLASLSGTTISTPASGGFLTLSAANDGLNVFNLSKEAFEQNWAINFDTAGKNATMLVNVAGESVGVPNINYLWNMSNYPDNTGFSNVLWNFADAKNLAVQAIGGSILAPNATLDMNYGVIYGNTIVGQLGTAADPSTGQFDSHNIAGQDILFKGKLPTVSGGNGNGNGQVPEPGTLVLAGLGIAGLIARRRK